MYKIRDILILCCFQTLGQSGFLKLWTISSSWWKVGILQMDFSRYLDQVLIVWWKQNLTWTSLKGYVIVPEGQKVTDLMRNWNWKLESQQKSPQPLSPFSFFCSLPSIAHSLLRVNRFHFMTFCSPACLDCVSVQVSRTATRLE